MPPQIDLPMEFKRTIGAFRVEPDWYEEYWLKLEKPVRSRVATRHPYPDMLSKLLTFVRGNVRVD